MSDVVSFAEIDGQHLELLQARTLLQTGSTLGNVTAAVSDLTTVVVNSEILSGNSASAAPASSSAPSGG